MRKGIPFLLGIPLLSGILLIAGVYSLSLRRTVSFTIGEKEITLAKNDIVPLLQTLEERWKKTPLVVEVGNKVIEISKESLGIQWDIRSMKRRILRGEPVALLFRWDEEKVINLLASLAEKTFLPPRNALWEGNRFRQAQEGKKLNVEAALLACKVALEEWKDTVSIDAFEAIPPEIDTPQALRERGITALLASFNTSLEEREKDVIFNIEKAAASLSGHFLRKGETFSFNAVVGRAGEEDGYRKTQILSNGRLVPGYGGGVCQVSSTLYNALLQTEAEILERHPHSGYSPTISYVPPGLDAAVNYGSKDLRFRFPSQNVVILAYVKEKELTCEIWGEKENTVTATIRRKLRTLTQVGADEGKLVVETFVQRNGASPLHFVDTYLIPWDFAQGIMQEFPDS